MSEKQKIVDGRGPSNVNLLVFVNFLLSCLPGFITSLLYKAKFGLSLTWQKKF